MIENVKNFIYTCENTLARYNAAKTDAERYAVLSRETVRGIQFAIDFCNGLDHECMTERELKHAIRLTYFRGANRPVFVA